jgi:hypothetical protein
MIGSILFSDPEDEAGSTPDLARLHAQMACFTIR